MHRITSGRKYAGGSITTGRKLKSIQELEEHGETMVKIAKVKPKPKAKKTITVTKTTPKIIPLPFLPDDPNERRIVTRRTMTMKSQWFIKVVKSKPKLKFITRDLDKTKVFKDRGGEKARYRRIGTNY